MKKNKKILCLRHGMSRYRQGNKHVSLDKARDLENPEIEDVDEARISAIQDLHKRLKVAYQHLNPSGAVNIHASPLGRTLHSAKAIKAYLLAFMDTSQKISISIEERLEEIKGFEFKLFQALVEGGSVQWKKTEFQIKKSDSNPKNLDLDNYLEKDAFYTLSQDTRDLWPEDFCKKIDSVELLGAALTRAKKALQRIVSSEASEESNVVIVTHDYITSDMVSAFTEGSVQTLTPGSFVVLEQRRYGLYIVETEEHEGKEILYLPNS